MHYPHPIIAREGWSLILVILTISIIIQLCIGIKGSWFFWMLSTFIIQFFRDPPRKIPMQSNIILSPADGRIISIKLTYDSYADRNSIKISIFMNVFNVHSQRSPTDGIIIKTEYLPGNFFNASLEKASIKNERQVLVIKTKSGHIISCVQIAGLLARRILCYVRTGDSLHRGQRYGFIRFGSRLDIFLPIESFLYVSIGQKVYASETILASVAS